MKRKMLITSLILTLSCFLTGWSFFKQDSEPEAEKYVRKYICHYTDETIKLDGVFNELCWEKAKKIRFYHLNKGDEKQTYNKPFFPTSGMLLWDKNNLYVALEAKDKDIWATIEEHDGNLWSEDVLEIFLKPSKDKRHLYEFELSPKNILLDIFYPSRGRPFCDGTKSYESGLKSAVRVYGTLNTWKDKDAGWTAEVAIPFDAFRETIDKNPKAGDKWLFALCRYDYSVYLEDKELSSSAKLSRQAFNLYEDYNILEFEE
ncbi:carbohydrate-binding family 9-like protein [bacterium]|nr:carbohydrate-binding family 9-like protein [bacterium]